MRVAVTTLGCKVNQYDSASIETRLRREGCAIVPFAPGADVYVVNTCTVTDRADAESRQLARRARRFAPQARIIMTGCFAQTNPSGAAVPEVDHVVGLNRLPDLVRSVLGQLRADERIVVDDLRTARRVRTIGADSFTGQTRAFLKVQEGCDLFCSFCIVPFARGRSRSVPPRQVLEQLAMLAARGFREVVLTGVHLGGYGGDLEPGVDLCDLMEMIAERPPLPRVRLSSVDPPEVTPRLLRLISSTDVFCPHIHMPVQSGEDEVLRRMRRQYDIELVREVATTIRDQLPEAAVGTDVIAGFPGETESQFESTLALLDELPLTYFHVFPYSPRAGTTAAKMTDRVAPASVKQRAWRLRRLGERKQGEFASRFVGRALAVLVEDSAARGSGWRTGYSRNYQRVEFPASSECANEEVDVAITARRGHRLLGSLRSQRQA
jgi:threonylcarbamoyladenosine tRNA methylthiotransferase MtaB